MPCLVRRCVIWITVRADPVSPADVTKATHEVIKKRIGPKIEPWGTHNPFLVSLAEHVSIPTKKNLTL